MASDFTQISKYFSPKRVAIPIVIGFSVALFLLIRDFNPDSFSKININFQFFFYLFLAIFFLVLRDFFYILRLRILTDKKISWKHAFQVIMLWEFTSAITPSVVGGSAVAMFIIHQDHISLGRSTAIVMITAIMDELFYIIAVPVAVIIAGANNVFTSASFNTFGMNFHTQEIFWIGYVFIVILIFILSLGVFVSPNGFKSFITRIFRVKILRKWSAKSEHFGDEIILTSKQLKGKPIKFWASSFGVTMLSWTSRFLVVNALIAAFSTVSAADHTLIFGRQLIMWVILLISPTPGGSGIAEYFFPVFLGDFLPNGIAPTLAFLWRLLTYYPYLFVGVIVFPLWVKRVIKNKSKT
ncbi:MAG: lysylphosphatidylglycerol synthase transmembrane domain-containing protein [Bacteroidota bacterium]